MPVFKNLSDSERWNHGKKNKTKKKKDYNKRGESKEGGEMDAFLDNKEGTTVSPLSPPPPPPPPPTAPPPVPNFVTDRLPSPILDREILSTIPLPGEILDIPSNDISPTDLVSDSSSVSPSADGEDKENTVEEPENKVVLKYSYKEDQWSPLNPEGKKQYDRDFLLQLQSQPMSLRKPMHLPNLDVIKDKAQIQRLTEVNRVPPPMISQIRTYNDPFMPVYARTGTGPRMPHAPVNRRSQGRGGEKPRKVISFTSSLNQNIKLHESQNAWKPMHKTEVPTDANMEELEKGKLKRSVQGVLNKLTPQKFETLLAQLKNLNIETEEKLALVIDLIFEKAVDEPNFSVPYANMCKHLAMIKVPAAGTTGTQVNFRKLLLTKCQKEFEQDRSDELKNEERMKALEAADPDKKKELKLEYDEEEKKIRYRQLGNIRFIGELFKLGMLIEPIMHECIKRLINQGDDESLECLCKLLKTIGKELDEGKAAKNARDNQMDMYFGQMKLIVDKRLTSSRVRFMLQDVVDLKKNNWVPRRDENNPKTIDQIHKEAEREAREQQQVYQNMANYPKRLPDDRDRRKNTGRMGQSEDGWTSSSKSNKSSYSMVDPSKLKLTKPDEVESIRLGPGGRGPQSWGRGSSGGTKAPTDSDAKTALTNRYSALAEQPLASNYEGRRGSQRSAASSRESSRGRNNQLPPAIRKTPSTSKERENLLETVKGLARATEPKVSEVKKAADIHVNGKAVETEDFALRGPDYNNDDMERKTKPLIDEFLHNNDFEEAIKCVMELASPTNVHMFITFAINQVLERSSQARYSLGQLLYSLLKKKIITFDQYKNGFTEVLNMIDEYSLDIPLIWDYMGEILEPMVEDSEFPLRLIKDVLQICIPSETAGKLVSAILHCAAKKKGTIKLGEVWRESGLQWTDFLGSDTNVNEFVQKHKLEFTVSPTKIRPKTQMSIEDIKKHLLVLFEKQEENEEIFDWIDANVSDNADPNFIRALVTVVHEYAITEADSSYALDFGKVKQRSSLLTRYIDHKDRLELQALYAVQALMNELGQPSGLLHQIFDILYDDDVITEEAFKEWELSDDPNEAEGKGVAVNSVKSFFMWLREPDEADE
ncbi:eukaryotic translation initiation factor 4 gamma 3 [Nephila pilipes]|uniref:Eukaryotic translation initiation factor 4 gamma 3 n=1 Tax=Nephila pilipes TaxID=299642 RepID=A0A8X6QBR7_NEPPI|nr:eukaryotic translation initiation factor 4 gamma 3 [Nephila pilipes]